MAIQSYLTPPDAYTALRPIPPSARSSASHGTVGQSPQALLRFAPRMISSHVSPMLCHWPQSVF